MSDEQIPVSELGYEKQEGFQALLVFTGLVHGFCQVDLLVCRVFHGPGVEFEQARVVAGVGQLDGEIAVVDSLLVLQALLGSGDEGPLDFLVPFGLGGGLQRLDALELLGEADLKALLGVRVVLGEGLLDGLGSLNEVFHGGCSVCAIERVGRGGAMRSVIRRV